MSPTPKPGILDIAPYVGGRASVPGLAKVFKLSSNESPLGPSPKAVAALSGALHDLALYPDGSSLMLPSHESLLTSKCACLGSSIGAVGMPLCTPARTVPSRGASL